MNGIKSSWEGLNSGVWLHYRMRREQYIKIWHMQMPVKGRT